LASPTSRGPITSIDAAFLAPEAREILAAFTIQEVHSIRAVHSIRVAHLIRVKRRIVKYSRTS
jgi:hypothetical protein